MSKNYAEMDFKTLLANTGDVGVTTSDEVIRKEVIKQLIYKRADFISIGIPLIGMESFDNLDIKYSFPSDAAVEYPVPEGAGADLTKVTWSNFGFTLRKAEGRFQITDEATIRGVGRVQWQTGLRRVGEALAKTKDENILGTLYSGAGDTHAAAAHWHDGTAANITTDISASIAHLLAAHGVIDTDLGNMAFVVPVDAWAGLMRILDVEGVRVSMMNWITQSYGVKIAPTKYLFNGGTANGIVLVKGADTAVHGVLNAPADVPLVEQKRHEGVGTEYIVRQFFATTVVPEGPGATTTKRILTLTGVAA